MEDQRRYYGLDALRGSMMMLGVVLHASQWYVTEPPPQIPFPTDTSTLYLFDLLVYFIHNFRMPLFFVLAGFFASLLMDKRGLKGTWVNRGKRILLPLLVSAITILPVTILFMVGFLVSARFGTHQLIPTMEQGRILTQELEAAGLPTNQPSLGHLWFLYYLLYFYLTIPLCHLLVEWTTRRKATVGRVIGSPWLILPLGACTTALLWPFTGGMLLEGFLFLKPHVPSLLYYGSFFVLGYLFHNHREILATCTQHLGRFALAALILFPLSVYASHLEMSQEVVTTEIHGFAVLANAFLTWSLIYVFMGVFLRFLDYDAPWIIYVSNASYWVYLIHLPLVAFGAWFLLPYDAPALIKFTLVLLFASVLCFSSYHYLVQKTWVGKFLNGMKFDMPWPWQKAANR